MSFRIEPTPSFQRQVKRLLKKFRPLKGDLATLGGQLAEDPNMGTPLGQNCYKLRLAITSKGKGKSGGSRVISHIHVSGEIVYLLAIYDKSEKENLDEGELDQLLSEIDPA